jgi:Domain of unknown function (DUF4160)
MHARIDSRVSKLIDDVQSYSNPSGQHPTPPIDTSPDARAFVEDAPSDQTGPDRLRPPDWFTPRGELADAPSANNDDVPAVSDRLEVPETSAAEEKTISATGVEALAFYAPFHFYQQHHWGIYIRDFGLVYLASKFLRRQTLTTADNWVLRCAYEFLLQHEYFHFQTELAVSRYEILILQGSIYLDHTYLHHFLDRNSSWLEESIANARGYREFSRRGAIASKNQIDDFKAFLASWMKTQPAGYRDYDRWNGQAGLTKGKSAISSHLHESLRHWRGGSIESDADILDLYREAEYSQVPIIRIPDARLLGLRSARPFPKAHGLQVSVFSNDHPPPHIHVDFLDGDPSVRIGWPSLQPLKHDRGLSRTERRNLIEYLSLHQPKILERLRLVFSDTSLRAAIPVG